MKQIGMGIGMGLCGAVCLTAARASEPPRECFRTPASAAAQAEGGDPGFDGGGFRLEGYRQDPLGSRRWALVRSCSHPERPALAVAMLREAAQQAPRSRAASEARPILIRAGERIRLVSSSANVRMELEAVAQGSGAAGQTVRVRLMSQPGEPERFLDAVVRQAGEVEFGGAR